MRMRRNSGTFTNPHPALLRPASPRTELATAGKYITHYFTFKRKFHSFDARVISTLVKRDIVYEKLTMMQARTYLSINYMESIYNGPLADVKGTSFILIS